MHLHVLPAGGHRPQVRHIHILGEMEDGNQKGTDVALPRMSRGNRLVSRVLLTMLLIVLLIVAVLAFLVLEQRMRPHVQ